MVVAACYFQNDGLSLVFDDGTKATAFLTMVDGSLCLTGLTGEQEDALRVFTEDSISASAQLDPRLKRVSTASSGASDGTGDSSSGRFLYYGGPNVSRVQLDGSAPASIFEISSAGTFQNPIAVDPISQRVFVLNRNVHGSYSIFSVNATTGESEEIYNDGQTGGFMAGLVVGGSRLYFTTLTVDATFVGPDYIYTYSYGLRSCYFDGTGIAYTEFTSGVDVDSSVLDSDVGDAFRLPMTWDSVNSKIIGLKLEDHSTSRTDPVIYSSLPSGTGETTIIDELYDTVDDLDADPSNSYVKPVLLFTGIAIDTSINKMYYTYHRANGSLGDPKYDNEIWQANLDGTGRVLIYDDTSVGVAIAAGFGLVYFNSSGLYSMRSDGSNVTQLNVSGSEFDSEIL